MEKVAQIKMINAEKSANSPLKITAYCDDENLEKAFWFRQIKNSRIIWEEEDDWERKMLKEEKKKLQNQISDAQKKINKIDKKIKKLKEVK